MHRGRARASHKLAVVDVLPPAPVLESRLGEGGFREVWKAQFCGLHVAMKRARDVRGAAALRHDANILASVAHPCITKSHGCVQGMLATELMEGCLMDVSMFHGRLAAEEVGLTVLRVAQGLAYLHSRYIVHEDIKEDNILVSELLPPFDIRIGDFGLTIFWHSAASCARLWALAPIVLH